MAHKPVGNTKSISTSNTSARSDVISKQSNSLRVVAVGADCHVAIGTNPTATASNYYVASGTSEVISLGNVKSQRVVGVTTGSTTTIDFPEGTGSPFEVGDSVELTGISPTGINTSYAIVSSETAGTRWWRGGQGKLLYTPTAQEFAHIHHHRADILHSAFNLK